MIRCRVIARQHDREDQDADPAADRHLVAGVAAEAGAVDHVGLVAVRVQRSSRSCDVGGLVLAVAVDLDGDVVAVSSAYL